MPQPGEIRHGQSGSFQWDGAGWNPVDVPNPMAGDAAAASAQKDAARKGDYFSNMLHGAGEALNPLNIPRAIMGIPQAAKDFVTAGKEAVAHPSEIIPAFENADPEVVGGALGSLLGMGASTKVPGIVKAALPDVSAADAVRAAGKVGNFDITKPAGFIKPVANALADRLEAPSAPEGFDRYMPNKGNAPRPAVDVSGVVTPAKGVEDVLNELGGYRADINSGLSPSLAEKLNRVKRVAQPDLFQQATADKPAEAFDWPEVGRQVPDESGSHHTEGWSTTNLPGPESIADQPLGPENIPDFTFQGEAIQPGHPPAVGGTDIAGNGSYTPRVVTPIADALPGQGGVDPEALDRMRRAIDPQIFKDWEANNPGYRTNRVSPK